MEVPSIAGMTGSVPRPFREPHHLLSAAALLGGGVSGRPGELDLAHKGILFLDELPEIPRETLEALRQPMQDKVIRISKRGVEYCYPADRVIIGAQNMCPCGLWGSEGETFHCTERDLARYRHTLSEPLLDRFELFCEVPRGEVDEVLGGLVEISGESMAKRIDLASERQYSRNNSLNALLSPDDLRSCIVLGKPLTDLMVKALDTYHLSIRSLSNVLKVARTIADLAGETGASIEHVQEALQYRRSLES